MSGPGNAIQCLPAAANAINRVVLNTSTQVFASCYEATLNETIATYCADSMDNRVNVTQQGAMLKNLSKNFQREIKIIIMKKPMVQGFSAFD